MDEEFSYADSYKYFPISCFIDMYVYVCQTCTDTSVTACGWVQRHGTILLQH